MCFYGRYHTTPKREKNTHRRARDVNCEFVCTIVEGGDADSKAALLEQRCSKVGRRRLVCEYGSWLRDDCVSTVFSMYSGPLCVLVFRICGQHREAGSVSGDRSSLCALFVATKGSSWTRGYHWNTPEPLKEWPGVYTSVSGRVKMLRLWGNSIQGTACGNVCVCPWTEHRT